MMYIEHFVLLAGAYNLGFFIELAEYFIFFIFKTVVNIHKRETATNHTPVYAFGLGYPPPKQKQIYSHLKLKAQ